MMIVIMMKYVTMIVIKKKENEDENKNLKAVIKPLRLQERKTNMENYCNTTRAK